jgi:hypothetical protein
MLSELQKDYAAYLNSDHWKHLRLKKSKHTKRCFICRRFPDKRNYHHVRYRRLFDVSTADIRLACEDCHHFYHAVKNEHPGWSEKRILKLVRAMQKATDPKQSAP